MSPTSYQTAPPRGEERGVYTCCPISPTAGRRIAGAEGDPLPALRRAVGRSYRVCAAGGGGGGDAGSAAAGGGGGGGAAEPSAGAAVGAAAEDSGASVIWPCS